MGAGQRITAVKEVPDDSTFLFRVRDADPAEEDADETDAAKIDETDDDDEPDEDEAVLTMSDEEVTGWLNRCMHFRHIRLDKGSGAPKRNGELVCANHGAMFEDDSGLCTYGPCEGAYLDSIEVEVRDGDVYLADDDYEFVGEGGIETDPTDLVSKSNIEF